MAIARNLLIDHHRRDRSDSRAEIDERLLPVVEGPDAALEGAPELAAALERLSERDREVLALRFGGDLSVANVQQIISRSLRRLRAELERDGVSGRV